MEALICNRPGDLAYSHIPMPVLQPRQAILKIRRVGICGTDLHAYEGTQPYFKYPRILGHELAADLIEADEAAGFLPGEAVTCIPYFACGKCVACRNGRSNCCVSLQVCGVHMDGGMCTYLSVPSSSLVHGNGLSYDELALIEPLAVSSHGVHRAAIRPNEFVLVVGAGPIGLGAMEFAGLAGGKVIAMDVNDNRLNFCGQHLKVAYTINPARDNALLLLNAITLGEMPTVIIDASGSQQAINGSLQYLAHGGRYILIGLQKEPIMFSHPEFHKRETTLMSSRNALREDFIRAIDALKAGLITAETWITHRTGFAALKEEFPKWLHPDKGVIKAMVTLD